MWDRFVGEEIYPEAVVFKYLIIYFVAGFISDHTDCVSKVQQIGWLILSVLISEAQEQESRHAL